MIALLLAYVSAAVIATPPDIQSLHWRQLGPAIPSGRMTAVVGSDRNASLYYAGAAGGGIFKSTNAGAQWFPVFEHMPLGAIGAIAISPTQTTPQNVFAAPNPPVGAIIDYYVSQPRQRVRITIADSSGHVVRHMASVVSKQQGFNRIVWGLDEDFPPPYLGSVFGLSATSVASLPGAPPSGPTVVPGQYRAAKLHREAQMMAQLAPHTIAPVHFDRAALRRGLLVSSDPGLRLFVDTGGDSVALTAVAASAIRNRYGIAGKIPVAPQYINRYYGGMGVQGALGARWIAQNPFAVEFRSAPVSDAPEPVAISLQLIDHESLDAYVACAVVGQRLLMLFDTGALAWRRSSSLHRGVPLSVNFVSSTQFEAWRRQHPRWQVRTAAFMVARENGTFVEEPAILVPDVRIGAFDAGTQWFVRRSDDSTYRWLRKHDSVDVRGDLGMAAFLGTGLSVDYPHRRLLVR